MLVAILGSAISPYLYLLANPKRGATTESGSQRNKKRVHPWYRIEGLQLRMRVRRRKHQCLYRGPVPTAARLHERWSMDFVHDALADGRTFHMLTVVDHWSRQSPVSEVVPALTGQHVAEALERVVQQIGAPPENPRNSIRMNIQKGNARPQPNPTREWAY